MNAPRSQPLLWVKVKLANTLIYVQLTALERGRYLAEEEDGKGDFYYRVMHSCLHYIRQKSPKKEDGSPYEIRRDELELVESRFTGQNDMSGALMDAFRKEPLTTDYMDALTILEDKNEDLYRFFSQMQISDDTSNVLATEDISWDHTNDESTVYFS